MDLRVYTVGHSTRSADEFVSVVHAHGIRQVVDIRTVPRSRRNPQFSREAMAEWLPRHGVVYTHAPALGGLRRPRADSANRGWRHPSFRGYADYMQTPAFAAAIEPLIVDASRLPTAIMCAEAVWWRCHRRLVADALIVRGAEVWHVMTAATAQPHHLTPFARVEGNRLWYPGLLDGVDSDDA